MTVIGVPYHLDEYLPDFDFTPEPAELITPELPAGDIWPRLAVLYHAVARAVTRARADHGRPVVVSARSRTWPPPTSPTARSTCTSTST